MFVSFYVFSVDRKITGTSYSFVAFVCEFVGFIRSL